MVRTCAEPERRTPTVNVYLCDEDDEVFDAPSTYREDVMRRGFYRGHHFGAPARLKCIDDANLALSHDDPGMIIWSFVIKYVLTVRALRANVLHLKGAAVAYEGQAFLMLGRGGSGKTEVVRALCERGAGLMANTHLLVDGGSACGIRSNLRVRKNGRDVYVPVDRQPDLAASVGWMPIGGVFWLKHRSDGASHVRRMPPGHARANMQLFSEAMRNWELKEDVADLVDGDPFEFAELVMRIDALLDVFCDRHEVHYLNLDIFSGDGMERLLAAMQRGPAG